MYRIVKVLMAATAIVLASSAAYAQDEASITGTVRDTSGAVLPGVTVEAASPALIEKVRSVVTDGGGQYRIVNLRPGAYTVTFTLPGFSVVKREGIELTGSFIATVNAELKVGELTETITVTGESPVVDVQNTRVQQVLTKDVVDSLPSGRTAHNIAALAPGVTNGNSAQDVGGTSPVAFLSATVHGSHPGDSRFLFDGFSTSNTQNTDLSLWSMNMGNAQEVAVNVGGGGAEQGAAGLVVNVIPKEGGNTFSGSIFATGATEDFQADNLTQRLRDRGVTSVSRVKSNYDFNPAGGGPIVRDRLWFYAAGRWSRSEQYAGSMFFNRNAGQRDIWRYEPDFSRPATPYHELSDVNLRATWQVNTKNKVNLYVQKQSQCSCVQSGIGPGAQSQTLIAPEAAVSYDYDWPPLFTATWTSPLTNRILLDGGIFRKAQDEAYSRALPDGDPRYDLIPVTDTVTATVPGAPAGTVVYHGPLPGYNTVYNEVGGRAWQTRASVSYITGAHALRGGFDGRFNIIDQNFHRDNNARLRYTFNRGIPVSLTQVAMPFQFYQETRELGLFLQDRWTIDKLTLNLGVRYDGYKSWYPDHVYGPALHTPNRNFTIPGGDYFNYHDITPKIAAAYDVFGNGKTALKATLNKHVSSVNPLEGNPSTVVNVSASRSWNDANGNFVPDCNLVTLGANGECGALPANFGQPLAITTTVDPEAITGWGSRLNVWEFSVGMQQELLPRVSADVTYFRRMTGNYLVTVNRALSPADFDRYSLTAPVDPRLPGGGGYVIPDQYDLKPAKTVGGIPTDPYRTLTDTFGSEIDHWNGVDVTVNARPRGGVMVQGGISTGRRSVDTCEIVTRAIVTARGPGSTGGQGAILSAPNNPSPRDCHIDTPFLTQIKGYVTYTIPRIDVQTAATFQNFPGPEIQANVPYTSAQVATSLGRPLSTATLVNVNVLDRASMYQERVNQLDLRFGKLLRFGRTRTTVALDLYNALNMDTVMSQTNAFFGPWQTPIAIMQGRIAKISAQVNF